MPCNYSEAICDRQDHFRSAVRGTGIRQAVRANYAVGLLAAITFFGVTLSVASAATVRLDATREFQVMDGFGANYTDWADRNNLYRIGMPTAVRTELFDRFFTEAKLHTGVYAANDWQEPVNDNADPSVIRYNSVDGFYYNYRGLTPPLGTPDLFIQAKNRLGMQQTLIFMPSDPGGYPTWLVSDQSACNLPASCLNITNQDEYAELITAAVKWFKDNHGIRFQYVYFANEPCYYGPCLSDAEQISLIKTVGARLAQADCGCSSTKIMLAYMGSAQTSLPHIQAILADAQASAYVGLLGFEGSSYGLWSTTAGGERESAIEIANLAKTKGIKIWQLSVFQNKSTPDDSWNLGFTLAKDIHRNIAEALVSSYNMWLGYGKDPSPGSTASTWSNEGIVTIYRDAAGQYASYGLSGRFYAFKHYSAYVAPGAKTISATSDDASVLATAYKDTTRGRVTVVLLNDSSSSQTVTVSLGGITTAGLQQYRTNGDGTSPERFSDIGVLTPSGGSVSLTMPAQSAVTLTGLASFNGCVSGCVDATPPAPPNGLTVR